MRSPYCWDRSHRQKIDKKLALRAGNSPKPSSADCESPHGPSVLLTNGGIYRTVSGLSSSAAGPTNEDCLDVIRSTRTPVSAKVAAEFLHDIEQLARL